MKALIFDCDGVLVDTERDGHRVAFNQAFREFKLDIYWDQALYGRLLAQVAGGKERMAGYFDETVWPEQAAGDRNGFIARLHERKSELFQRRVRAGLLPLRPGVARIVDEALARGLRLGVCTTAHEASVLAVLDLLGAERKARFEHVLAGDAVERKKPDPEIYALAAQRFGLEPATCLVIEDSNIGMRAALGAGMKCVVTTSGYTAGEDFSGALNVFPELGDPPAECVGIDDLLALCDAHG